ncbi:MAG: DNA repair protein RadA [Rhodospirillaceae bacterium]|nr:DNA repair protein RadA [Rhodospirillaceae bacterium]
MAKAKTRYVCQDCGAETTKWSGRCDACGAWNTISEESAPESAPKGLGAAKGRKVEFVGLEGGGKTPPRTRTGINELDRALGGGLVDGSAVLVAGDPGIGKSTILLQAAAKMAAAVEVAYISGEESIGQIRLRGERLGLTDGKDKNKISLAAATNVRDIVTTLDAPKGPKVVIIDSIQTMYIDQLESAPGTVSQVRTSAHELIRLAKRRGFALILVGHVTKEGQIAGPRVLEHMVDTVLYFEGEKSHQFRILRAVKNRFGATDEIGVFEMSDEGLIEVANPSALFLSERDEGVSGSAIFAGMEGTRPMLLEIQALVSPTQLSQPRRAVVGWDSGRLAQVMAVTETRCGLAIGANDVYLNVAGGLKIIEPAADMAVAAALMSSLAGKAAPLDAVFFGEIGLSGEVRSVSHIEARIKEAAKLGFKKAFVPSGSKGVKKITGDINVKEVKHLSDLVQLFDE